MSKPYYNDQAHIAEEYHLMDDHITQTARLASFKISSYKLSLINATFGMNREELHANIKASLLHFTLPGDVLIVSGFFDSEYDN